MLATDHIAIEIDQRQLLSGRAIDFFVFCLSLLNLVSRDVTSANIWNNWEKPANWLKPVLIVSSTGCLWQSIKNII